MLRWSLRILTSLSALLCLACISLWLRSCQANDSVNRDDESISGLNLIQDSYRASSGRGFLWFNHNFGRWQYQSPAELESFPHLFPPLGVHWNYQPRYYSISAADVYLRNGHRLHLGFGFTSDSGGGINPVELRSWQLVFPRAALTILFSLLPFLRLRIFLKSRRRQFHLANNLCPSCGYDLRASREKCPECGYTAPAKIV